MKDRKFCRFCGVPNDITAVFCQNCGKSFAVHGSAPVSDNEIPYLEDVILDRIHGLILPITGKKLLVGGVIAIFLIFLLGVGGLGNSPHDGSITSTPVPSTIVGPTLSIAKATTTPTLKPSLAPTKSTISPTPQVGAASTTPTTKPTTTPTPTQDGPFYGSKNSNVYHYPSCRYVNNIHPENLISFPSSAAAKAAGYRPCEVCKPP